MPKKKDFLLAYSRFFYYRVLWQVRSDGLLILSPKSSVIAEEGTELLYPIGTNRLNLVKNSE